MTEDKKVEDIMTGKVPIVSENDPVARVRNIFLKRNASRALVYEEEPKGILTDGDIARAFAEERRGIDEVRVREIMTRSLITTGPNKNPEDTAQVLIDKSISALPVISQGEVKGILSKDDLTKYYSEEYKGVNQVEDLMTEDVKTIRENQSVFHGAKMMKENDISRLVVMRDRKPIGIITEKDLSFATQGRSPHTLKFTGKDSKGTTHMYKEIYPMIVSDIMQKNLKTTKRDTDAAKAALIMYKDSIGSLIVAEEGELKGIITKTDLTKYLAEQS